MPIEIERKFLVTGAEWRQPGRQYFCQGYLNRDKERTVRVRIAEDLGFLTIKGITHGPSRQEFEYPIPVADARELLQLCERPWIEKYRTRIDFQGLTWEVDEFLGENSGLILAEVELAQADQPIALPPWVGEEVTCDTRYLNANLVTLPYQLWG
jgi:adenylate cyclase